MRKIFLLIFLLSFLSCSVQKQTEITETTFNSNKPFNVNGIIEGVFYSEDEFSNASFLFDQRGEESEIKSSYLYARKDSGDIIMVGLITGKNNSLDSLPAGIYINNSLTKNESIVGIGCIGKGIGSWYYDKKASNTIISIDDIGDNKREVSYVMEFYDIEVGENYILTGTITMESDK